MISYKILLFCLANIVNFHQNTKDLISMFHFLQIPSQLSLSVTFSTSK